MCMFKPALQRAYNGVGRADYQITIRNIYVSARDMAHRSACGYMNIHEHTWTALGCTAASHSTVNIDMRLLQARKFTVKYNGESWPKSSPS